jgi:hypothetical protein
MTALTRQITATITVDGEDSQLEAYRARVNAMLDADSDASYRERHERGRLDYRIEGVGVPYPPFVNASADFPELLIEVNWNHSACGEFGRAIIQAGLARQVVDTERGTTGSCEVRVDGDGTLALAIACERFGEGERVGYVLTATQHAFFRCRRRGDGVILEASDGVEVEWAERWTINGDRVEYRLLAPREPIAAQYVTELDRIAAEFAAEWIWFEESPQVETAVERQRYEAYGFKVNAANVRAVKLKTALGEALGGGFALEISDPEARDVAALISRHWLLRGAH